MKAPKIADLKKDEVGTKNLRRQMAKAGKVKITINLDSDLLKALREMAHRKGAPYQSLINRLLREVALGAKAVDESRLDRLERQVDLLKRKLG